MSELKPCPFCGGEAKLMIFYNKPANAPELKRWSIVHECEAIESTIFSNESEAEAIEAWNRRAEPERDFLREVYDWAFAGLECCDDDEWKLFNAILMAIARYRRANDEL